MCFVTSVTFYSYLEWVSMWQNSITCTALKTSQGMFSGISRRMSSFIFGASPAQTAGAVSGELFASAALHYFKKKIVNDSVCCFLFPSFVLFSHNLHLKKEISTHCSNVYCLFLAHSTLFYHILHCWVCCCFVFLLCYTVLSVGRGVVGGGGGWWQGEAHFPLLYL